MTAYRKLIAPLAGLALITALGTLGYVLVEGMSVADALFMTVITISTVGYGEVQPLSPAGRIFTVGLILIAVGLVFYLLTRVAEILVQGSFRELYTRNAMQNKIDQLSGHVIICGYGRLGRIVAEELERAGTPQVIVEIDVTKEPELQRAELPYLIGSALSDDVIERAGIARASSIVAATRSDSDNVFITLSAREHSADIRIHARGESDGALRRLKLAGADTVMSAYQMGGLPRDLSAALSRRGRPRGDPGRGELQDGGTRSRRAGGAGASPAHRCAQARGRGHRAGADRGAHHRGRGSPRGDRREGGARSARAARRCDQLNVT
jgi:voltage-gated potassium channel